MSFRPKKAAALSEAEGDAWHREVEKSIGNRHCEHCEAMRGNLPIINNKS
jgi:hypothetical protein